MQTPDKYTLDIPVITQLSSNIPTGKIKGGYTKVFYNRIRNDPYKTILSTYSQYLSQIRLIGC